MNDQNQFTSDLYKYLSKNRVTDIAILDSVIHKIGKATYKINKSDGHSFIFKMQPPVRKSIIHKIWRRLFSGGIPFQNEIRLMRSFNNLESLSFKTPLLLKSNKSLYYTCEYIEDAEEINFFNATDEELITISKAIFDLGLIKYEKDKYFLRAFVLKLMESPSFRFIRDIFNSKKHFNVTEFTSIIFHVLCLEISRVFNPIHLPPRLSHNDLRKNNILRNKFKVLYIIDWEDASFEKKWIFHDLCGVLIDILPDEKVKFFIKAYCDNIIDKNKLSQKALRLQFEFSFLVQLIRSIQFIKISNEQKQRYIHTVKQFIKTRNNRDIWWDKINPLSK